MSPTADTPFPAAQNLRPRRTARGAALALALSALVAGVGGPALAQRATGAQSGPKSVEVPKAVAAAANPLAVEAGVKILRAGGSAVDAAVAMQAVLGLVEPQSSGLGGGAFMLHFDAKTKKTTAYDGRETAPAGATPDMFLGPDGRPLPFPQAVTSGRATGVPGAIAMLSLAQKEHGRLKWSQLFGDAEKLAGEGFIVSPRMSTFINSTTVPQASRPDVQAYFGKPDGTRYKAGELFKSPAYAATLKKLAAQGPDALLKGEIAQKIVDKVRTEPLASTMTLADLAGYRPKATEALCKPYRIYVLCTPQLPSGGPALQELMGILANTDIAKYGPKDAEGWYLFAEASKLMYADRDYWHGDAAFTPVPLKGLLDPAYLKARAGLIGPTAAKAVQPGKPMGAIALGPDATLEPGGTSSLVVIDARGDVVVMTTTVESIFGTGRMVDGFFLNNQLTDFSLAPMGPDGKPAANAVGTNKRPRSSMTPSILLDAKGNFVAAIGSPGGVQILAYVGKALVGMVDWKLSMPEAIDLPNVIARGDTVGTESTLDPAIAEALKQKGLTLAPGRGEESGLHGAMKTAAGVLGAADPRREGIAAGF